MTGCSLLDSAAVAGARDTHRGRPGGSRLGLGPSGAGRWGRGAFAGLAVAPGFGGAVSGQGGAWLGAGGNASCGFLIDDMESGSVHICPGEGREGIWNAFNDGLSKQFPAPTPGTAVELSEIPGGRGDSRRAMYSWATINNWARVGIDLPYASAHYGVYDASAYGGIAFWARVDSDTYVTDRSSTQGTTLVAYGGTCTLETFADGLYSGSCGPSEKFVMISPVWTRYEVPFAKFSPEHLSTQVRLTVDLEQLTNIKFVPGSFPSRKFDFWIDDVWFLAATPWCGEPSRP